MKHTSPVTPKLIFGDQNIQPAIFVMLLKGHK